MNLKKAEKNRIIFFAFHNEKYFTEEEDMKLTCLKLGVWNYLRNEANYRSKNPEKGKRNLPNEQINVIRYEANHNNLNAN